MLKNYIYSIIWWI